jgi:hypothetical protein
MVDDNIYQTVNALKRRVDGIILPARELRQLKRSGSMFIEPSL